MLESLKIIVGETFEIYMLATLDGRLFIPFFICLVYLLVTAKEKHSMARRYMVYPALVLLFFLFNPVFIHFLYKFIEVPERIVRMYWPLPMDFLFIYCVVELLCTLDKSWKKAVLLAAMVLMLFINAGGSKAGLSFGPAENPQKLPKGAKEVSDALLALNDYETPSVMIPSELFFWTREYHPYIQIPYVREQYKLEQKGGPLDLKWMGETAIEGGIDFIVLSTAQSFEGSLEEQGFEEILRVEGRDCQYLFYELK